MKVLRSGIAAMLVGNGVFAAAQFLMLVALARATTPETVGRYSLALAITAPVYLAANLKLRHVAVADTANDYSTGQYLGTRFSALAVAWVGIACVVPWVPGGHLLLAVSTLKALDMASDILYALPHRKGHFAGISASMSVRGVAGALAFTMVLWEAGSVEAAVWSAVLVYAVGVMCDFGLASRYDDPKPSLDWRSNRSLLVLAAPLGIAMAASSLGSMLPRYALQVTQGAHAVGIYSALAYLLVLGGLVINSVAQVASPHLARQLAEGDVAAFQRSVRFLRIFGALLGLVGAAVVAVAGKPILGALFGHDYESGSDALTILMVAAAISYAAVFAGTALNAMRRFDVPLPVTVTSCALGALLLLPATTAWDIEGAAAVVLIMALAELLLYQRAVRTEFARRAPGVNERCVH